MKNLIQYKEFLKSNIKKEIRGKYKGSILGVIWSFLNPLLQVLVYAIVFPIIMKGAMDNYVTYLVVGILPWSFFVSSILQGVSVIRSNASIIKKIYFPREILPISVILSNLVSFLISCVVIFIFVIGSGIGITINVLFLPLIIIAQCIISLGIVFFLSSINVYFKDIEYITQFVLNLIMYSTPVLFTFDNFPDDVVKIMYFNPITHIIIAYQDILFYKRTPDLYTILAIILGSILIAVIGFMFFKGTEKKFAEEL